MLSLVILKFNMFQVEVLHLTNSSIILILTGVFDRNLAFHYDFNLSKFTCNLAKSVSTNLKYFTKAGEPINSNM